MHLGLFFYTQISLVIYDIDCLWGTELEGGRETFLCLHFWVCKNVTYVRIRVL